MKPSQESLEVVRLRMDPALKLLLCRAAERTGATMGEYVVGVLARHFKRPDLAAVPRKRMGRPPMMRGRRKRR